MKNLFLFRPFKISVVISVLLGLLLSFDFFASFLDGFISSILSLFVFVGLLLFQAPTIYLHLPHSSAVDGIIGVESLLGLMLGFFFLYGIIFLISIFISLFFQMVKSICYRCSDIIFRHRFKA